ncbi:MAG: carboxylating nicotinate-nucleotide diphosphorylase [Gemmatimonadales bacterium]|nr:MAG: carboxylating nicotinate-nucleotide diphosphorylase [Gemmatimonadales bacterium]
MKAGLVDLVAHALEEDVGSGDVTSLWAVPDGVEGRARVVARAPLVTSGLEPAMETFRQVDPALRVRARVRDGDPVEEGGIVLEVEGPLGSLLTAERTALNFLGRLSGVATQTRRYVEALRGTSTRVLDTRKTTPGMRELEKAAVRHGGGTNHRVGLHDMVLLKENHIAAAGGITPALQAVAHRNGGRLPVEIELRSPLELALVRPWVEQTPPVVQRILLDNMDVDTLRTAVAQIRQWDGGVEVEASGNLDLDRLEPVARTGVDFVSVGALTHSAPVADLSLLVEQVEGRAGGAVSP